MRRPPLIEDAEQVTVEWMRQALAAGGASDLPRIESLKVEKLSEVTNALGNLFRCRLTAPGGAAADPASVIVKIPTSNPLAFIRAARWLSLHRREYVYYRDVAPHGQVRVPSLLYGDFDASSHPFVLVLEDLEGMEGVPQIDGVGAARARRAIREIAALQGRFWEATGDPALSACGAFLTTRESRLMQTICLLTLPAVFERFGDLLTSDLRRLADAFGTRVAAQFAAVAKGPKTIVHGDYRGDNVLFGGGGRDDPVAGRLQGVPVPARAEEEKGRLTGSDDRLPDRASHDEGGFAPPPKRQATASMACVVLAMFLGALSQTVVATTMPLIIADLGGFDRYAWAATSYMVTATLAYPIVGGGAVMTCCYVAVADLFRPKDRGKFHGLLSAVYGVSFVAGPILGGFLADALSWNWAFLVIGLAGIPVLLLTAKVRPEPAPGDANDVDAERGERQAQDRQDR